MDIQKLTKKNQEFIHIATNQLIKDGKSDQEIKDILGNVIPELIENQKKGITGRGLLGAPTVWAASFSPEKHQKPETGKPNKEVPETLSLVSQVHKLATASQPFFQCHSLEALLCIPLITTSTVTITNQKKNVQNGGSA